MQVGQPRRQRRADAGRALDRVGELRGMRAGQRHHRDVAPPARDAGDMDRDRAMRVEQLAGALVHAADRLDRLLVGAAPGREAGAQRREPGGRDLGAALGAEARHQGGGRLAPAAPELEQQALEVAGDLDVHRRAEARLDPGERHVALGDGAPQDVVAVGRDDQRGDGQAHAARRRDGRGDVVGDLHGHARPVDGVHRREGEAVAERDVGEHGLEQVLAVVEGPLQRDVVDVGRQHRRHLPALHLRGAALRVHDEDVDRLAVPAGLDRGR
ncbi:MAG: hypothetical protein ACKOUS_16925, partial [Alphaproteobacteria bacterium]